MWAIRAFLIAIIVIAIVAFASYNAGKSVSGVNLIWAQWVDVPLVTVVFWSFTGGLLVSLFLFISIYIKQVTQVRNLRRGVKALEGEVTVLRNRPIEESADLLRSDEHAGSHSGEGGL
jgi:uncharacterized membrane protein YciS (DUF1049 family)